jgi:hypothetical protein
MAKLTKFGEKLVNRIRIRREQLEMAEEQKDWYECIEREAKIDELELMWVDLLKEGILYEKSPGEE